MVIKWSILKFALKYKNVQTCELLKNYKILFIYKITHKQLCKLITNNSKQFLTKYADIWKRMKVQYI